MDNDDFRKITFLVMQVHNNDVLSLEVSEDEARFVIAQLQEALTPDVVITKEIVVECWNMAAERSPTFIYALKLLREKTNCGLADGRKALEAAGYRVKGSFPDGGGR